MQRYLVTAIAHTHTKEDQISDNTKSNERLTIKYMPPNLRKPQRWSYWPTVSAVAREYPGEWVRTERWFHRAIAAQVASDLRNGHRRSRFRFGSVGS